MNVDEAWRQLGEAGPFPRETIQWSLDHWEEAAPRYVAKLRAFAGGAKFETAELDALFFAVHLCGEKRDERAYAPLCRILADNADVWDWLGDALADSIRGVLINVFDGDVEPLKQVVASPQACESSRSAALTTLGYLVRARGAMSDDEMRAYLGEVEAWISEESDGDLGFAWAFDIAALGYDSMMPAIARALSRGALHEYIANFKDYHADLQRSRQDRDGLAAFRHENIEPFGSTIETFEPRAIEREKRERESMAPPDAGQLSDASYTYLGKPYVNPMRTVGRNDPCPCGSGKKYKKCCLAA